MKLWQSVMKANACVLGKLKLLQGRKRCCTAKRSRWWQSISVLNLLKGGHGLESGGLYYCNRMQWFTVDEYLIYGAEVWSC